jgi:hypothetical protein
MPKTAELPKYILMGCGGAFQRMLLKYIGTYVHNV